MGDFIHAICNVATFAAVTGSLSLMVAIITLLGNLGYKLAADALQIPCSAEMIEGPISKVIIYQSPQVVDPDLRTDAVGQCRGMKSDQRPNSRHIRRLGADGRSQFVHNLRLSHRIR